MTQPPAEPLTPEEIADLHRRFTKGEACQHCGGLHARACPRIRRMTWHPDGKLAEVEFWPRWSDEYVIWPEQAVPEADSGS